MPCFILALFALLFLVWKTASQRGSPAMAGRPERCGDGVVALVALRVVRMESGVVVYRRGGPDRPVDAAPVWHKIFWGEEGLGTFQCCT